MLLTIAQLDYTAFLDASHPLTIDRKLNEPSLCRAWLTLPPDAVVPAPQPGQPLTLAADDGTLYFTGHIATPPTPEYCGLAATGPLYRLAVQALSEEALLDQALMPALPHAGTQSASALIDALLSHAGSGRISSTGPALSLPVASFSSATGAPCSRTVAHLASQLRSVYRVHDGVLTLTPIPAATHTLSESAGTLTPSRLTLESSTGRAPATDITVCGPHEPAACVTEIFQGDGITTQFFLSAQPFFLPAAQTSLLTELFDQPALDTTRWSNGSAPGTFSVGTPGLVLNGGSGIDGETVLSWIDPVEMGGTLLLEASGLTLTPASTGILAAFYSGMPDISGCIAGFQAVAAQGTGAVSLQPILRGSASGPAFALNPTSQYTLRLRVHCPEIERTLPTYFCADSTGTITTGGQTIPASALVTLEVQEFVSGVAAMPVTLYDGALSNLPASCSVVAASSLNLHGSIRALRLTHLGSGWVASTPPNGGPYTRRLGSIPESAECALDRSGKLVFYPGFAPTVGEQIAVTYRTSAPSAGRAAIRDPSPSAPATPWIGSVLSPAPRSSADCRNAASALLAASSAPNASWTGIYRCTSLELPADILPGDALSLNAHSAGLNQTFVVRTVRLTAHPSVPDLLDYEIAFANDWADDLALQTSAHVPAEAPSRTPTSPTYAPAVGAITITALTPTTVSVHIDATPPQGGGFEVRRRDNAFVPGEDPELVLRGTQPNLTWTRQSENEAFYIRMHDAASPPHYSEFSTALILHLPLGE